MTKPWRCPNCRSRSGVPVRYGLPTDALLAEATRGTVVLGGCVLGDDDPPRCCTNCRAALWPAGVFALPGGDGDLRVVLTRGLGSRRLEARVAPTLDLTVGWSDGPDAERPLTVAGDDLDLVVAVGTLTLILDGASFEAWLRRRGLGYVGGFDGPIDRFAFTSDGMMSFTGPGGDLLLHTSVERFALHLMRALYREHGYGSVAELREWLSSLGLDDIVRSA